MYPWPVARNVAGGAPRARRPRLDLNSHARAAPLRGTGPAIVAPAAIRLFEAEPDLARFLPAEDRSLALTVTVPLVHLDSGPTDIRSVLRTARAFSAIVVDGMLLQSLRVRDQTGLRLLGPGDLISLTGGPSSTLILRDALQACVPTHLAMLGREFALVTRRWPWMAAGLSARAAEQVQQLLTQLIICQLPRVDDRVLAMMWLLAESWGKVTPSGTLLPLQLTHSALGGLIGARRPTVTLALGELTERGAVRRQPDGWLLVKAPEVRPPVASDAIGELRPLDVAPALWGFRDAPLPDDSTRYARDAAAHADLRRTVARLQAEHRVVAGAVKEHLQAMASSREQAAARRLRISERWRGSPTPSSGSPP